MLEGINTHANMGSACD